MTASPLLRGFRRRPRTHLAAAVAVAALTATTMLSGPAPAHADDPFSLEFDGAAGTMPSALNHETGAGGWGNNEVQNYTADRLNSRLDGNGNLLIEARRAATGGWTSARLTTKDSFEFTYGTISARISLPQGRGLHPAFWLLGSDIDSAGYPAVGEVDIAETINTADWVRVGAHGPTTLGTATGSLGISLADLIPGFPLPGPLAGRWERGHDLTGIDPGDFHVYAVTKTSSQIRFTIDGNAVHTINRSSLTGDERWVFDKPMYALLNVAVGGNWPGPPSSTTPSPATMTVDWLRYTP
ncbi:glycoside hydrolase family 16 protein [Gordonia terrae]|uniref:glycoside hydrolase family 16 protein n=1 Tax=Gordonia terrae TaxID=2055 RepID=UPI003F6BE207